MCNIRPHRRRGEMADTVDSKSTDREIVSVQVRSPAYATTGGPLNGPPVFFRTNLYRRGRRTKVRKRGQDGPGRPRRRPGSPKQDAEDWKASPIAIKSRMVIQRDLFSSIVMQKS